MEKRGGRWQLLTNNRGLSPVLPVLRCRYVELNPVKASMVEDPIQYEWSSYRLRLGGDWRWLDQDSCYEGLASSLVSRAQIYRQFVSESNQKNTDFVIQQALQRNQIAGNT